MPPPRPTSTRLCSENLSCLMFVHGMSSQPYRKALLQASPWFGVVPMSAGAFLPMFKIGFEGSCNTDAATARLWQTVWDLTEGVLGCREYRSTSCDTLSCPRLVARS
eukprot:356064-Chlamydomonas_euryale.AAC.1